MRRAGPLHVSPALAIVALALVILGGILAFPAPALSPVFLILAVVLIYLYIRKMRKLVVQARDAFDAEGVGKEFVERFGRPFTGSAVLREQEELLSGEYHQADLLRKQLDTEQQELSQLRRKISECLQRLAHVEVEQTGWQAKADELTAKREDLDGEITKQRLNLAALGVDAADCICETTGETYDPAILPEGA